MLINDALMCAVLIDDIEGTIRGLGQDLFNPPNVGGWTGGVGWANSATALARYNFSAQAATMVSSSTMNSLLGQVTSLVAGPSGPVQASMDLLGMLELSNQTEAIRERLQQIFNAQVEMVEKVITEAVEPGDVSVDDTREAAGSVVAQLEGQVLFAKLYNNTQRLDTLWTNCLSLLGAGRDEPARTGRAER